MANIRIIRRRIRSVQNSAKITKAMQMIAASKMRRAQQLTLAGRPYSEKMLNVLADLAAQPADAEEVHPLLRHREFKRIEVIHITPDRGLCGGLNSNLNRTTGRFILEQNVPVSVVTVGRKGRDFMVRFGREVRAVFTNLGDRPGVADILPIAHLAIEDYTSGYADQVLITYSNFVTTAVQRPVMQRLLPVEPAALPPGQAVGYIYEPRSLEVLGALLPRFVEMQLYHAVLESIASEQSARMVAMRAATDNALEMIDSLTLMLNKARQESITRELLDIVGGAAALEG
ncbi:MAG: ATP synthase F1 subunit gamma [Dehalococcoidia bacterium]|nr:ATP synthase F1 subunit gamma [Dehalococcoidia bacterium]